MNDSGDQSRAEYYALIRSQIDHHDNLINQRTIWQIITQSFFVGAFATLLHAPARSCFPVCRGRRP